MVKETSQDDNNNAASKRERRVSFNVDEGEDQLKEEVGKEGVLGNDAEVVESVDKTKHPLTKPEPFKPDLRPMEPEHVQFRAEDVRESRREERLMRK